MACVLLGGMFRWPVHVAIALAALCAVAFTVTAPATNMALRVAALRGPRTTGAVALCGVAGQAVYGWWRPLPGLSYGWWLIIVVLAYAALVGFGAFVRTRLALVESLRERARRSEAEQGRRVAEARAGERTALAREMHDVLAHRLSLVATYAGALEYRPDAPPAQIAGAAGVVREGVHQALNELREVIGVLREDTDPTDRPQPSLADLPALIDQSRAAGTEIQFDHRTAGAGSLPPATGRAAYRIVQEGLTNARKHAAGQPVRILVEGSPGNGLRVELDNPVPPGARTALPGTGTGLVGLTERVRLTGGVLDHELRSGNFLLSASLPWPGEQ